MVYLTGDEAMEKLGGTTSFAVYAHAMRDGVCLLTAAPNEQTAGVRDRRIALMARRLFFHPASPAESAWMQKSRRRIPVWLACSQ